VWLDSEPRLGASTISASNRVFNKPDGKAALAAASGRRPAMARPNMMPGADYRSLLLTIDKLYSAAVEPAK
jgi:hypothetical protein